MELFIGTCVLTRMQRKMMSTGRFQVANMKKVFAYLLLTLFLPTYVDAQQRPGLNDLNRFDDTRFDMVYDKATELTWSACIFGQVFIKKQGCTGDVNFLKWDQVRNLIQDQWRVPTKDELHTIISSLENTNKVSPRIDIGVFHYPDRSILNFWTSTEASPNTAWAINFGTGPIAIEADKSSEFAVRLVKGSFVPPLPEVKPPKDIGNYISRRDDCEHFAGEDAYDKERAQYLDQMFAELQCNTLGADEKKLRKKYHGKPAMLKWLDEKPNL